VEKAIKEMRDKKATGNDDVASGYTRTVGRRRSQNNDKSDKPLTGNWTVTQ
jgi:hypothetical protein